MTVSQVGGRYDLWSEAERQNTNRISTFDYPIISRDVSVRKFSELYKSAFADIIVACCYGVCYHETLSLLSYLELEFSTK